MLASAAGCQFLVSGEAKGSGEDEDGEKLRVRRDLSLILSGGRPPGSPAPSRNLAPDFNCRGLSLNLLEAAMAVVWTDIANCSRDCGLMRMMWPPAAGDPDSRGQCRYLGRGTARESPRARPATSSGKSHE